MVGPGCMGGPLASLVLPPLTRHSKRRGSLARIGQRFPPRKGRDHSSSDIVFTWRLGIRYAPQAPRPDLRSDGRVSKVPKVTVTYATSCQSLRPLSVSTKNRFSPIFCVYNVDKSFALPTSFRFFRLSLVCLRVPVSKLVLDEFPPLVRGLPGPF